MKKQRFLAAWVLPFVCLAGLNQAEAKETTQDVKDAIDNVSESLKRGVDKTGNDLAAIQHYLENYTWKGIIQDQATSGVETLSELKLNGHHRVAVVYPGEPVYGKVHCFLNPNEVSPLTVYRVVVGIQGEGPQTTIGRTLGIAGGRSHEKFVLKAPQKPGFYQIRFRTADNYLEHNAFHAWYDEQGNEPDGTTTIGLIYVKPFNS